MLPGDLIIQYRTRIGFTQRQLAGLLGFKNERMVRQWEANTLLPPPQRLRKLVEIFGEQEGFPRDQFKKAAFELWQSVELAANSRQLPVQDQDQSLASKAKAPSPSYPSFDDVWFANLLEAKSEDSVREGDVVFANASVGRSGEPSLKSPPNRLIGRDDELNSLTNLLKMHKTRFITITGAGGIGKTRLALEIAASLQSQYNEGVAWVELAALSNPAFLAQAIATTTGIKEIPGLDLVDNLIAFFENKEMLLVLDNCEHLLNECAKIIRILLKNCPNLQILATSREKLYLEGETVWQLGGLDLREGTLFNQTDGNRSAAVDLFLERAVATGAVFNTSSAEEMRQVVEICRKLDGLPLALELVAAQTYWLSLTQIINQLYSLPFSDGGNSNRTGTRFGRTMQSSFNWSYDLLSDPEKHLLQHLSIFRGSFALEAVEAICLDENLSAAQVSELLFP